MRSLSPVPALLPASCLVLSVGLQPILAQNPPPRSDEPVFVEVKMTAVPHPITKKQCEMSGSFSLSWSGQLHLQREPPVLTTTARQHGSRFRSAARP